MKSISLLFPGVNSFHLSLGMNCRMQRFLYWDQSTSATFPQSETFVGAWVGLRLLIKFINGLSGRLGSRDKPSKMGDSKH